MKKFLCVIAVMGMTTPLAAQFPPESVENLQVLPSDMTPRQVIGVMRSFAIGLGVRCEYCHVGEAGQPLSSFDFISDDKATKQKAREMLRMVQAINNTHLAALPGRSDPPVRVQCATCHHGVALPVELATLLAEEMATGGVDAALARYDALREEYYGGYSYDFTERALIRFVEAMGRDAAPSDQIKVLNRNLELFPNSVETLVGLGQAHNAMGHKDVAIELLERAVELAPEAGFVRRVLEQIRGS